MPAHEADAVFQGGGVKGLGLVGAVLEFADRSAHPDFYVEDWVQLAGTSAGAIIAAYLACGKSAKDTRKLVAGAPYATFEDWGPGGEVIGGGLNLLRLHGLARGRAFHDWFDKAIDGRTFADVERGGRTLKLIAADITRREMLVLPDALGHYRQVADGPAIDPAAFPIADAVRTISTPKRAGQGATFSSPPASPTLRPPVSVKPNVSRFGRSPPSAGSTSKIHTGKFESVPPSISSAVAVVPTRTSRTGSNRYGIDMLIRTALEIGKDHGSIGLSEPGSR